jgi:hypothetical protein
VLTPDSAVGESFACKIASSQLDWKLSARLLLYRSTPSGTAHTAFIGLFNDSLSNSQFIELRKQRL